MLDYVRGDDAFADFPVVLSLKLCVEDPLCRIPVETVLMRKIE